MKRRSTLWVVMAAISLAVLAGCLRDDRVNMEPGDLVGTWRSPDERSFTFHADGKFVAIALPHQELAGFTGVVPPGFDPAQDSLDGSGEWRLEAAPSDKTGPHNHVDLFVQQLSSRQVAVGLDLRVERQGSEVVLAIYLGDPDLNSRIVYRKCLEPCVVASPAPTATG
jgi:hypothetical protein